MTRCAKCGNPGFLRLSDGVCVHCAKELAALEELRSIWSDASEEDKSLLLDMARMVRDRKKLNRR